MRRQQVGVVVQRQQRQRRRQAAAAGSAGCRRQAARWRRPAAPWQRRQQHQAEGQGSNSGTRADRCPQQAAADGRIQGRRNPHVQSSACIARCSPGACGSWWGRLGVASVLELPSCVSSKHIYAVAASCALPEPQPMCLTKRGAVSFLGSHACPPAPLPACPARLHLCLPRLPFCLPCVAVT
jgi:hypothetical protein